MCADLLWIAFLKSCQLISIRVRSRFWLRHFRASTLLSSNHLCGRMLHLALLKINILWSCSSFEGITSFAEMSSRNSLYVAAFIFPSTFTGPADMKYSDIMMLRLQCYTVGMMSLLLWTMFGEQNMSFFLWP